MPLSWTPSGCPWLLTASVILPEPLPPQAAPAGRSRLAAWTELVPPAGSVICTSAVTIARCEALKLSVVDAEKIGALASGAGGGWVTPGMVVNAASARVRPLIDTDD